MDKIIKKVPMPITGLMLGLAAAGNLVQSYGEAFRNIFGVLSAILLVLILAKIIMYPNIVKEELKNPVVASVFLTLTMGTMLLSTYIKPFAPTLAFVMWVASVIVHVILFIKFIMNFVVNLDIKKVFPSWFIVAAGTAVASVSAPAFEMQNLGRPIFWVSIVLYFLLLPRVIKRVRTIPIPEPAAPVIVIFAAPVALCLAGYMSSFPEKNMAIVWGLLIISQVSYIFALTRLPKLLKLQFYPSYSAFTFPFVISAISLKLTNGFLVNSGQAIPVLGYIVKIEEIIAVVLTLYVLVKYLQFLTAPAKEAAAPAK